MTDHDNRIILDLEDLSDTGIIDVWRSLAPYAHLRGYSGAVAKIEVEIARRRELKALAEIGPDEWKP